jgi:hypothetical protein
MPAIEALIKSSAARCTEQRGTKPKGSLVEELDQPRAALITSI